MVTLWTEVTVGAKRSVLLQSRTCCVGCWAGLTVNFVNIYSRLPPKILLKQFLLLQKKKKNEIPTLDLQTKKGYHQLIRNFEELV